MSVLISMKVSGDVAKFKATLEERRDELASIAERAKGAGAVHHRFGIGDGYVLVIDEWQSESQFQSFFNSPELQAFVPAAGASGEPEIVVGEAISTPDEF